MKNQPHAILDVDSRRLKARKIERLLGLAPRPTPTTLLEIGIGGGGIAHYFAHHPTIACQVTAVDVLDQRQLKDGFRFLQVADARLPFDAASFDIVISNHVIEHVGGPPEQELHLREIKRVLKPAGMGYLALPNRWMLVEPHYRLAFLSWLPEPLRTPYLRLTGKGERYDCLPLSKPVLERRLARAGLLFHNRGARALHEMLAIEPGGGLAMRLAARLPAHVKIVVA